MRLACGMSLLTSASHIAMAQETGVASADEDLLLEEIIVTAQKRAQSLQDVPFAVSAFGSKDLEVRTIENISDLQFSIPNFVSDSVRLTLRGVGNNAISSTSESGLGYHVNGVYLNSPIARSTEYFDIERIEVLRGPQGTLYGRNTTAGVVNIISRRPTENFGGYVNAEVGTFDSLRLSGAVNIPIGDNLRQRVSGYYFQRDGYTRNLFTGNRIDGRDSYAFRSATQLDIGENTVIDLTIDYLNEDSDRQSETKGTCTKDATFGCSALSAGFETPDVSASIWQNINFAGVLPAGDYFADAINPADFRIANVDQEPSFEVEDLLISLEINHDFENMTLTLLSGYHDTSRRVFQDFDRFATDVRLNFPVTYRADFVNFITTDEIKSGRLDTGVSEQFSQEIRLASDFEGRFNFLLGGYYFTYEGSFSAQFSHPVLALDQQILNLPEELEFFTIESNPIESDSIAFFGEGYYDLNEKTRLTVGLRHTWDDKAIGTRTKFLSLPDFTQASADWSVTTGKVSIDYRVDENSLLYATVSRGYKAGGLNPGGPAGGETFDPEYLNTIELGSKSEFADGRIRANFNAFYYDYEGLQIGSVRDTSVVTTNADADIKGAELELTFTPVPKLFIDLSVAYLDVTLDDILSVDEGDPSAIAPGSVVALDENGDPLTVNGNIVKNLAGNTLRNAPNWSVKAGADYAFDIDGGYSLLTRVDYLWQDTYFANEYNKPSDVINSWSQADASMTLSKEEARWQLRAFVKNIFNNDDVIRRGQDGPLVGRFRSVTVLEPRTFGVELRVTFGDG